MTRNKFNGSYPVIYLVCDQDYFKYLHCFLHFLDKNVPNKQVFIHFINIEARDAVLLISKFKFIKNYSLEKKELNTKNTKTALAPFSPLRHSNTMFANSPITKSFGKLYSEKEAYCANIRFVKIVDFLNTFGNDLIYIDVDNIINKDISELYNKVNHADLIVTPCLPGDPRLSTTLFGIKNNVKTRDLFNKIKKTILPQLFDWGADHNIFNGLVHASNCELMVVDPSYHDESYGDGSHIWINHLTMYGMADKYQKILDIIFPYNSNLK